MILAAARTAVAPYKLYIYAGIAIAVGLTFVYQRHTIREQAEDIALYKQAQAHWQDAQTIQLDTINDLQGRITAMVNDRKLEEAAMLKAVSEAFGAAEAADARYAATSKELANVYARNPQARAWSAVGVPAAVADRLPGARPGKN